MEKRKRLQEAKERKVIEIGGMPILYISIKNSLLKSVDLMFVIGIKIIIIRSVKEVFAEAKGKRLILFKEVKIA